MGGIERVGLGRTGAIRPWGGPRLSPGFSVPEDDAKPAPIAAPIALGGLIGLHEHNTDDETPARQQADALLTELAALQRTLLGGGDPISVLQRLDGMLGSAPDSGSGSPPLLALLAAARMRAKVELARRGWGPNR